MSKARAMEWTAVAACLLLFLLSRLPMMGLNRELNPDESHFLAQAMRFEADLTPWLSVDAETSGPVSGWVLCGAHQFGLSYNYSSAHRLAALCLVFSLFAVWLGLRRLMGARTALLALALLCFWLAATADPDHSHYSSEVVPTLLLALGFCLVVRGAGAGGPVPWRLLLAGFALGLSPWTKLQATPLAASLALWGFLYLWLPQPGQPVLRGRASVCLWFLLGLLLPSLILLGWLWRAQGLAYFWAAYITANQTYAGFRTPLELVSDAFTLLQGNLYAGPAFLLLAALCLRRGYLWRGLDRSFLILAPLLVVATALTLLKTNTQFGHYQMLTVVPVFLLTALALRPFFGETPAAAHTEGGGLRWLGGVLVLVTLPWATLRGIATWQRFQEEQVQGPRRAEERLVEQLRPYIGKARSVAVTGFSPSLYVGLGLPPASRHAVTHTLMMPHAGLDLLRASYLEDLEKEKPELLIVVGSLCPAWAYGIYQRAEPFGAFDAYLEKHYHLAGLEIAQDGTRVMIYNRDQR